MSERTDRVRFFLDSRQLGRRAIEDISNLEAVGADKYALTEQGHFTIQNTARIIMRGEGYKYLLGIFEVYGPTTRVDFIMEAKDDTSPEEPWVRRPVLRVNMYTLSFDEQTDNPSVSCDLVRSGDLATITAGFRDEFDITGVDAPPLQYVNLRLDPRKIERKSRFINSTVTVNAEDDQGKTARAVPLELDYSSDQQFIGEISNVLANSVNDTYAKLAFSGNVFIQNAPRDLEYILNGTIEIETVRRSDGGAFTMDLVRYSGGEDRNFEEIVLQMASGNTGAAVGTRTSYTFNDYPLVVNAGDSIGIMTLSEGDDGGVSFLYWEYITTENTFLELVTETPYPVTYTKALKPFEAFKAMGRLLTADPDYGFASTIFGPGGRHEDKLLVHGTWLRNMPQTVNEGTDEERRIQALLSLQDLYGAYSLTEPLRYDVPFVNKEHIFTVGAFKDIQQNFTGIRITSFEPPRAEGLPRPLQEVSEKERDVLGENFYRSVKLGSETSGSNYGQVNNLFSTAGYAEWSTPHKESEGQYEVLTEFRTGAEDIEIQRQFQYSENPDQDGEYDNDWFLVDAKKVGDEYVVKTWQDYFSEIPTGVYSPETNYNWFFSPVEILRRHGYKINVGMYNMQGSTLTNPSGNCNLSLVTRRPSEVAITANRPFPVSLLEKPRIKPMMVNFAAVMTPEILEALSGDVRGVDNKAGLVEVLYNSEVIKGRLFEATTEKIGKFKIIQI